MSSIAPGTRLSLTGKHWLWPEGQPDSVAAGSLPAWVIDLLTRRGVAGPVAIERYLNPSLASLDDPLRMADMATAVEVILRALEGRQPITVYGDYDVDGVCSTALLVQLLSGLGAEVDYYIPDRRSEGYGLNQDAVREICKKARLLITTDCGITAHAEVAVARQLGCEVVVVDHHRTTETLPAANANLDPKRADCGFPFKELCATGVAFMLAGALRRFLRDGGHFAARPEPDLRELLDLVALATVADVVPMVGLNRVLVTAGLRRMAAGERVGLAALCEAAALDPTRLSSFDLGYRLGPRINARGRISHAGEAVELMLTRDAARARLLASALEAANRERRELEKRTVEAARRRLDSDGTAGEPAIVLYDPAWHPGVLGLVASRLASSQQRPAIIIGEGGKGSGRSIEGLDLHAAIGAASPHLLRFGGHAAAAGVTIEPDRVDAFRAAFTQAVRAQLGEPPYVAVLRPDLELAPERIDMAMLPVIERLAPFGHQNPEPLWVSAGVSVRSRRVVGSDHLKLTLGAGRLDAIGFGLGHLAEALPERLDVAYRLARDEYKGANRVQLRIEDLRESTAAPALTLRAT
jgi:single-stranded-DNA-specific exonuclease